MADEPLELEDSEIVLNPIPDYINKDRKERESFLSQVGNFSTEERELFNLLCDNWEHEIGYAKFVTKINKKHPIDEKFLDSLMKKLRSSSCGILLTKFVRGERGVDKIILTNVDSHFFYYYFINNEFQKNLEEVSNDFIDESNFEKYDINTSSFTPLELPINQLNKGFIRREQNRNSVFQIKLEGYKAFYVTSESLQDLLKISIRKIKYYFKSDNFIAFIAKILNSSISKVRTIIANFDISTWKTFSFEILKNKKLINSKFKNMSSSFFKAVSILYHYSNSELKQKDKELEDEKKLKATLKEISEKVRANEFKPLTQESFNSLFEVYDKSAPEIKAKFYELYVDNKTKTGLTEVVFVGQYYIHQDNLYKVFLDQVALATAELNEYYIGEFRKCLLSNSSDASLLEGYPFEANISDKLQSDYPIIYDLFNRKGILAESIIHFSKKRSHSQGKMHNLLAMYFIEGSSELKSFSRIFNLDVTNLFEKAYDILPIVKRFFIIIFGQYNKYVERFTGHKKSKKGSNKKGRTKSSSYSSYSNSNDYSNINDYSPRSKTKKKDTKSSYKQKKVYNKEQIDDAWNNLGSELTKKKRT